MRVDLLSRFRTGTEQKKTVEDLKKGFVDIVIGTHRVLSKDVVFKDLGLLIIISRSIIFVLSISAFVSAIAKSWSSVSSYGNSSSNSCCHTVSFP